MSIVSAVEAVNQRQKFVMIDKIKKYFNKPLAGLHFALWGLTFKPNTDDMREAPSLIMIRALIDAGAYITAYDPVASEQARIMLGASPQIQYANSPEQACDGVDALIIATEWRQFYSQDLDTLKKRFSQPVIFDCRNIFDPEQMQRLGFAYHGIGRGSRIDN